MPNPAQLAFLKLAAEASVACEMATRVPAELTVAQAILESGWGSRMPGQNAFGIKADGHGAGTQYVLTHEYLDGTWQEMPLAFEQYASLADCFADHARLICQGPYLPAWQQYQSDHKLDLYIAGIARHYATNPMYAQLVTSIVRSPAVVAALRQARNPWSPPAEMRAA